MDTPEVLCYLEEWAELAQIEEQVRSRRFDRLLAAMETAPRKHVLAVRSVFETRGRDYFSTIRLGYSPHEEWAGEGA